MLATNANGEGWSESASFTTSLAAPVLTAYYDFEGTGADRFDDPAGAFADKLIGGQAGAVFSTETAGAFAGSQSISFDDSYTLFTDAYTTDLRPGANAFTISFWIKAADIDQENTNIRLMTTRVQPDGSSAGNTSWQIEGFGNPTTGASGDNMDVRMRDTADTQWLFTQDATNALARADQSETATWRHVAFVISNTRHFTGLLDDVALFAGVVEEADIAAIAAGTLSPADFLAGGDPFSGWATSGTVTGVTFDGDANGDGVRDGIAFLLGAANPDDHAGGLLPMAGEDDGDGLRISFTMRKPTDTAPAVLTLEHSGDLGIGDPWVRVVIPAATGAAGGVSFTVAENAQDPSRNDVIATIKTMKSNFPRRSPRLGRMVR